jgi:hypothetical protein
VEFNRQVAAGERSQRWNENSLLPQGLVEAPAFMRGKERFSAPGKSLDFDHAL